MDPKILQAVKAVRDGMRVKEAAIQFEVPIATLYRGIKKFVPGRKSSAAFTPFEEEVFVTIAHGFERFGLPLTRKKFLHMVKTEAKGNRE